MTEPEKPDPIGAMRDILSNVEISRPDTYPPMWKRLKPDSREGIYVVLATKLGCRFDACGFDNYELYDVLALKAKGKKRITQQQAVDQLKQFCLHEMLDRTGKGGGLVMFGPEGTGKDHLMATCMFWAVLHYGLVVDWRDGGMLNLEMREMVRHNESERTFIAKFLKPHILAISDVAPPDGEGGRAFYVEMLQKIVDQRYRAMRPVWCTINSTGDEASRQLSPSLVGRLRDRSLVLECAWPTYRKGN